MKYLTALSRAVGAALAEVALWLILLLVPAWVAWATFCGWRERRAYMRRKDHGIPHRDNLWNVKGESNNGDTHGDGKQGVE